MTILPFRFSRGSAFAVCVILCVASRCLAAVLPVESRISQVAVYPDRAVVVRSGSVDLREPGQVELEFRALPLATIEQSLQMAGEGSAEASILDVSLRREFLTVPADPRIQGLEEQVKALQKQLTDLEDREAIIRQQEDFVEKIRNGTTQAPGKDQPRPTIEDWQKLLVFNAETLTKLTKERRSLDASREELNGKIDALRRELASLQNGGAKEQNVAIVRLKVDRPGALALRLSYALSGANWTPVYDARLSTEKRSLELAYYGLVRNTTGEDWNNVTLTLSTARPSLGGSAPELGEWYVDVEKPRPLPAPEMAAFNVDKATLRKAKATHGYFSYTGSNADTQAEGADLRFGLKALSSVGTAAASVETNTTSATFAVEQPVTVRSDGSTQKVPVSVIKWPAELEYKATPKLNPTAFLGVSVSNDSDYPLLSGSVSAFLDGAFVATASLKTVMPGEKFELSLGADEGLSLKHQLVRRFTESTGLTSKGRRVTYEYRLTLINNKKTEEKLSFSEPIPVSRNEKILVKLLAPTERELGTKENPREVTLEEGKLTWKLVLKPGEKREIPVKFSVEYPAELPVTGVD